MVNSDILLKLTAAFPQSWINGGLEFIAHTKANEYFRLEDCEYLNYYIDHNREMAFGDTDLLRLEGWLDGYSFAKKYVTTHKNGETHIKAGRNTIVFQKPFVF